MGRDHKDLASEAGGPQVSHAGGTPGKRTRTEAIAAGGKPGAAAPPAPGITPTDWATDHPIDDPFGLHLSLDVFSPASVGLERILVAPIDLRSPDSKFFPSAAHQEREVTRDFAALRPGAYNVDSPDGYLACVRKTFGSIEAYLAWRPTARAWLDLPIPPTHTPLRRQIDGAGAEQEVFFTWVSWGYHQQGLDADAVVKLVAQRMSPAMREALAGAGDELGAPIKADGFVPRLMKNGKLQYRLGVLSEHALGNAVDIDPAHNPILTAATWRAIEAATGITVDRSLARWDRDPIGLFVAVSELDAAWVARVHDAIEQRRTAPGRADRYARNHPGVLLPEVGAHPPPPSPFGLDHEAPAPLPEAAVRASALRDLLGKHVDNLDTLAALPGYHFLGHSLDLVCALRRQGLRWGVTFGAANADLHHFELAEPPLSPWPTPHAPTDQPDHSHG